MARDFLRPCPGCDQDRMADAGHHLCRQCEGYPPAIAIAVQVSPAEQDWIDSIRAAAVEHAVERGHLRRG